MDYRKDIIEASQIPKQEKVWLRKGFTGWKVVHPIKDEDGKTNWFNLLTGGSWWNVLITVFFLILIVLAVYEYYSNINMFLDCFRVPGQLEVCKQSFGFVVP